MRRVEVFLFERHVTICLTIDASSRVLGISGKLGWTATGGLLDGSSPL